MCNFFAQADALATGKTAVELRAENVPDHLIPHKTFTGNRPSLSIMLPDLTAYTVGQILALYENRVAVQVCVRTCLRVCVPACLPAYLTACLSACLHVCVRVARIRHVPSVTSWQW